MNRYSAASTVVQSQACSARSSYIGRGVARPGRLG